MCFFQNSQNLPQQKTFQLVHECLRETNNIGKEKFANDLKKRKGMLARLRQFLFLHPNSIFLVILIFTLVLLGSAIIIRNFVNIFWFRLSFLFMCTPLYLMIPLFLERITPKFEMGWDERWSRVLGSYLSKTQLNDNVDQAKRNIKKAILYYSREGKSIGFIVNLMWGGIFIGCLPEPSFQKALITMSVSEIFHANLFGSVCLLFLPFVYVHYFVYYEIPIAWMEHVLAQIELEE